MHKRKILVVEDEPSIAETLQYALQTEGFEVICRHAGAGVVELLAQEEVSLILLDIGLPDISGFELCKEIRKRSFVPVIFLTARSDEIDRVVGLEIGGDDYVVKPFSPREVTARVKAVLRRTGPTEPRQEDNALFSVDGQRRLIRFCGVALELSRYEFDLLAVLIGHPGRVFSREQLMEKVWEEPETSLDRTIDAHIKNIRAKLRQVNPDMEPIVTHRGVGYAMMESP